MTIAAQARRRPQGHGRACPRDNLESQPLEQAAGIARAAGRNARREICFSDRHGLAGALKDKLTIVDRDGLRRATGVGRKLCAGLVPVGLQRQQQQDDGHHHSGPTDDGGAEVAPQIDAQRH